MSELYKISRAAYYSSCSLAIMGAVLTVGVPLAWFTGRIRMDHPKPWLIWLAGILIFAFYAARTRAHLRSCAEERARSGD